MKEKIHPPKVEIGPSSFFDDGPADPQLVTVASGPYLERLPIAGRTVAELRQQFQARFDIDPASTAVIGGKDAGEDVVLDPGVTIMFMNRAGEKGAGKLYKLNCISWNVQHVSFVVFDPIGANCGSLTVLTSDAINFVANSWSGEVFWDGKLPADFTA